MLKGSAVMRKWKFLLILAILSSLFAFSVYADTTEVEHDGYILRFKDEAAKEAAMLYLEATGNLCGEEIPVSEVYEPENLYKSTARNTQSFSRSLDFLNTTSLMQYAISLTMITAWIPVILRIS